MNRFLSLTFSISVPHQSYVGRAGAALLAFDGYFVSLPMSLPMDDKVGDRGVESEHPNAAVLKPLSLSPPLSTSQIFLWSIIVITLLMCLGNLSKGFGKWVAGPLSLMIQAFLL